MAEGRERWLGRLQALIVISVVQIGWFACVLGAAWGLPWLGPIVVAILLGLHLLYSRSWGRDLTLIMALALFGTLVETLHIRSGFIVYTGQVLPWLAPPWIIALWAHFGTMRHAFFKALHRKPIVAALSGAIGGPLAYAGGVALGAADFAPPAWKALLMLSVTWAVAMPLASYLAWRRRGMDLEGEKA